MFGNQTMGLILRNMSPELQRFGGAVTVKNQKNINYFCINILIYNYLNI